jgi:hypothetical protein
MKKRSRSSSSNDAAYFEKTKSRRRAGADTGLNSRGKPAKERSHFGAAVAQRRIAGGHAAVEKNEPKPDL